MDHQIREEYFRQLKNELHILLDEKTGLLSDVHSHLVPCPLCCSSIEKQTKLFIKDGYTFVRCDDCQMIFTNPQVHAKDIQENYESSVSSDLWVKLQLSEKERGWKEKYYTEAIDILKKYSPLRSNSLLDVGCSVGHFLEILRDNCPDWEIEGIEFNQLALETCIKKNLFVQNIPIELLPEKKQHDICTLFGVLEHLSRPHEFLRSLVKRTKKGGLVMIVVPNVYSLYHMFLQDKSRSFDGRNHLLYFSIDTLTKLLNTHGLNVIHFDTVLTGLDNILRQAQWLDPNSTLKTKSFLPKNLIENFNSKVIEEFIYKNNLGLRLRVLARKEEDQ